MFSGGCRRNAWLLLHGARISVVQQRVGERGADGIGSVRRRLTNEIPFETGRAGAFDPVEEERQVWFGGSDSRV